jgi:sec-independent protein translocase protein TatA
MEMIDYSTLLMFLPAGFEWILVLGAIVALFFGVKKIPQFARSLGSATSEYEKARIHAEALKGAGANSEGRGKLEEIANTLGINHESRSDSDLRKDIQREIGGRETI